MSETLVLVGLAVMAVSGVPGLFLDRRTTTGQRLTTGLAVLGAGLGLIGLLAYWVAGGGDDIAWPWPVPGGEFRVGIDGLSAVFLLPVFLIFLLGSVYGLEYWKQTEHPANGQKLRLFYGLLGGAMALLVVARNAVLFLAGWEIMAVAAFFLVTTEDDDPEVREAGWIYLAAAHLATLALFALFGLLRAATGSFTLGPVAEGTVSPAMANVIFGLAVFGFGLKAGIMPLHVWLPGAHGMAPSHVSAIMSGVIIKMGIYGLVRVTSWLPDPPVEWGGTLLTLGAVSGILGVAFAIGQHDLKRLLAYHSIENIGIIVLGLGLALVGRSLRQPLWVVLGLGGALLHVWNHALFKALLFLSAGSVIHATHTREIDHLGGLAKAMPRTALAFLVGAVAICGLPPLNGFVSELLIYLGLFETLGLGGGESFAGAAFGVPALALIGTLAVACFVKVFGAVFLGTGRSPQAELGHEAGPDMLRPMAVLAGCCFVIGLVPVAVAPVLDQAIAAWAPAGSRVGPGLAGAAPLGWITLTGVLLIGLLVLGALLLRSLLRRGGVAAGSTWGCGYLAPTPRIQYTSSSFAQLLVGLFGWVLRPRVHEPGPLAYFPAKSRFHSEVPETVLDEAVLPAARSATGLLSRLRVLQQGSIQLYLLYIFVTLLALLLWP